MRTHWKVYKKFPILLDKAELNHQYIDLGLSCQQIANKTGCSKTAIKQTLARLDIPKRNRGGKVNSVVLSPKCVEFLEGELLGDGCIGIEKHWTPWLTWSSKHKEYLEWIKKKLQEWGIKHTPPIVLRPVVLLN